MLGKSLLLCAALCAAPLAQAQAGAYASFTATRFSGFDSSPNNTAGVAYNSSVNPTGGTFGAFYDFRSFGPVRLGVDARFVHLTDSRGAQTNTVGVGSRIYSTLGGVRASVHTPVKLLVPYAQVSAGLGRSDYGILTTRDAQTGLVRSAPVNNLEYHVFAGADYNLLPFLGWRVVELGYGGLNGGGHNYPLASVSTGLVLRFGN